MSHNLPMFDGTFYIMSCVSTSRIYAAILRGNVYNVPIVIEGGNVPPSTTEIGNTTCSRYHRGSGSHTGECTVRGRTAGARQGARNGLARKSRKRIKQILMVAQDHEETQLRT
ncbi:hypothetical protein CPB83DRAFT_151783 [Crepidotus variabilis]|uniref:Uncharacterized protein n=1 Tax=Crepidotus variabilis TaxID=179855 RepID=A0A9P6E3R5_9AGAR|nr:hypothetical protein CPB83DRAFT_151783 [Crepidotus variabilis]